MTAHADLEPTEELGLGFVFGSGWFEPTCKVEIDDTRPAQSLESTAPAHGSQYGPESIAPVVVLNSASCNLY